MANKKYWKSFGELNNSEAYKKSVQDEFQEELLPLEDLNENMLEAKTPRRDFLKYVGFSTAAAAIAAGCEMPVRKTVPLLHKPDDMIAGVPNWYASTYVNGGDVVPVLVKQREGRPIKIEGNPDSTITGGGTSAQVQASVLDLYDTSRLRFPLISGKEATYENIDRAIGAAIAGKPVVILTSSITSPTTKKLIAEFIAKFPGSRHVQYDAVSASGMLLANETSYGKRALPSYHFEKAKVIVSLGADFLGRWISPVEFSHQYSQTRKVSVANPVMSKHFQFEGHMSLTGSNADERYLHKPSETGAVALALLNAISGGGGAALPGRLGEGVKKAAAELAANRGAGLVVCGSNDPSVQTIVNAINNAIGANGTTIDWSVTSNYRQGVDADFATLVNEMNAGSVPALFVYDCNPSYSWYDAAKFNAGLKKVALSVSFNEKVDETSEQCKYQLPSNHWLESWGDAEAKSGFVSMIQPVIHPLFKTRPFQASLLKWSANPMEWDAYFTNHWTTALGGMDQYNTALQKGVAEPTTATTPTGGAFAGNVADATSKITTTKGGTEFVVYENIAMGTGAQGNNPWLLELPDPITKATWDNYAMISPAMAKELFDIDIHLPRHSDKYEVNPQKPVIKIDANGKSIELAALIIPGMHPNVIAIALGYGRQSINADRTAELIGRAAVGAGKNVYPLTSFNGASVLHYGAATVTKTGSTYEIAQTQVHNVTEGRPIVRETTLKDFIADPGHMMREEKEELAMYGGEEFVKEGTLYPHFEKPGAKWGMSIDLNTCTGCSACVIACHAENNVPVVGKHEVTRYHDMQWIRIDRYFTGDMENPDVVYQPMLCQHCDNAPCENVCPVSATNHSSEGINQMAYNRCIGTRYCANNCPYKVRRFNWGDYMGADSFPDNQEGILSDATMMMNDELSRMVLNPDVTVRSRGVMEKCTFCIQRTQDGKLKAKKENRPIVDADVQSACAQACPTHAIVFGNVNDKNSAISKLRDQEQKDRKFYVLEQLHVLSNVNYLVKVRNTDRVVGDLHEEEHAAAGEKKEHS